MTKPSVGIKPWSAATTSSNKKFENEDLPRLPFMKWKNGINNVRIVTDIGDYYQARVKLPTSKVSYGERVRSSWPTYDDCPIVNDLGLVKDPSDVESIMKVVKARHMVIIIDRADDTLKIMDMAPSVMSDILTSLEVKNSRRAEGNKVTPRDFDISIKFSPKASPGDMYSVVANDNEPLSDQDRALIEDVGGADVVDKVLARQLLCPKRETVVERLKKLGWDGKPIQAEAKEELSTPQEDDYSFGG